MESDLRAHWLKGEYTYTKGEWRLAMTCMLCGGESYLQRPSYEKPEYAAWDSVIEYYKSKLPFWYVWSRTNWEWYNVLLGLFSFMFLMVVIPLLVVPSVSLAIWTTALGVPTFKLVQHSVSPYTWARLKEPVKTEVGKKMYAVS